jgi:zinc protease
MRYSGNIRNLGNFRNWGYSRHFRNFWITFLPTVFSLAIITCTVLGFSSVNAEVTIQEFKTPKNIEVIFVEDRSSSLISVNFSFRGTGSRMDPHGKEGLASIMTHLLLERASTLGPDRYLIQKQLRSLGVTQGFQSSVDADNINFGFKCPKEKLNEVFAIVKTIVATPDFDPEELAKMKNFDPASARLATSGEIEFANKILIQKLLAPHPCSFPAAGTIDSRQSITIEDVKQSYQSRIAKNVLVLSVIGDISPKDLSNLIDTTFGTLPEKATIATIERAPVDADGSVILIPKDSPQSGVVFGQEGIYINDKDYLSLLIINNILGGKPFTSRLWHEAREKHGLVYSIQTELLNWNYAALIGGSFESDNSTVQKVIELIRQEWKNVRDNGVTEAEFTAAKTGLQGSFVLHFTSPDGIANYILNAYLKGLPTNYINKRNQLLQAVTLEEVNRVAKSRLDPEKLTFVVVGNPKGG